jgi:hypothetical protein
MVTFSGCVMVPSKHCKKILETAECSEVNLQGIGQTAQQIYQSVSALSRDLVTKLHDGTFQKRLKILAVSSS